MNISFKTWLAEMGNPTIMQNPAIKNAANQATKAAALAVQKKQDPIMAAKQAVLKQVQTGTVNLKDMSTIMPKTAEDDIQ